MGFFLAREWVGRGEDGRLLLPLLLLLLLLLPLPLPLLLLWSPARPN